MSTNPYLLQFDHKYVETVKSETPLEGWRAVDSQGNYPAQGGYALGLTCTEAPGQGTESLPAAVVPSQLYSVGQTFYLTAAQAVNLSPAVEGYYQALEDVTPDASGIILLADAAKVRRIELVAPATSASSTPLLYGGLDYTIYQEHYAVVSSGIGIAQVAGAVAIDGPLQVSADSGKLEAHTGTNYVVGHALTAAAGADEYIQVRLVR